MELYAAGALAGVAYATGYQQDAVSAQVNQLRPMPSDLPSMRNMYESNYSKTTRDDEERRRQASWTASQNPQQTGVIPNPAYASMFDRVDVSGPGEGQGGIRSLSGDMMGTSDFKHNNMTPYFGSRVKQNMSDGFNMAKLESFTGRGDLLADKEEPNQLFTPTKGFTNVCGMQNVNQFYSERIEPARARNNDFPIAPIQVGPGLDKGYTAKPSGGHQQNNTLDILRPKTVDELRVLTKPKTVYEGRVTGPAQAIAQRGLQAPMEKNRPDTYFNQTEDQWIRTTGAIKKEAERPIQLVKATNRLDTNTEYTGPAFAKRSKPGQGSNDDYGKESIMVYDNARDITGASTVVTNVTSIVKAAIAPLMDILRHNKSEYFVDHSRTFGSMNATFPEKPTMKMDDEARTTIRETTEDEETERNMSAHVYKNVVWDPVNHMARTTIKETTVHDTGNAGNLTGPQEKGQMVSEDKARTTTRETMPVEETNRNISSRNYKTQMYNPEAVAKATHRQSMAGNARQAGNMGGASERSAGAYTHIPITMYPTQKQFISDHDYMGDAGSTSDFRPMDRRAEANAEIDGTREALNIAGERIPSSQGPKNALSKEGVLLDVRKIETDSIAQRSVGNVTNVINSLQQQSACEFTKQPNALDNALENRLDPSLLDALRSNPLNLLRV